MKIDFQRFTAPLIATMFRGSLPEFQAAPMRKVIDVGLAHGRSVPEIAYALATGYHETQRFLRMTEIGAGANKIYGQPLRTWSNETQTYFGRGIPQLTWLGNYGRQTARLSARLGRPVDLVNNPGLAADPEISAEILWDGMIFGTFTGKSLADYFAQGRKDYVGARAIINRNDQDALIASYAEQFEAALTGAALVTA